MIKWKTLKYKANRQDYKFAIVIGNTIYAMDKLDNKRILGVADEAQRRSIAWDDNIDEAHIGYIDCPRDMIVDSKENTEEFAIVLGSKDLQGINKNSKIKANKLVLSENSIPYGTPFEGDFTIWLKKKDLILDQDLYFDQYMDHKGWGILLHDPRIEGMPKEIATHPNFKEHYGKQMWEISGKNIYKDAAMGFHIANDISPDFTGGSPFRLSDTDGNGGVYSSKLNNNYGRLLARMLKIQPTLKWTPQDPLETLLNKCCKKYVPSMLHDYFRKYIADNYKIENK